jgi:hypothetical protein
VWRTNGAAIRGLRGAARHAAFLSPGLADAALSSLAGFAASLYAVRTLDGPALGAYSLLLSASIVGALFAQHLLFLPSQIAALKAPRSARAGILGPTLWRGGVISLLVAPLVACSGLILGGDVASAELVALGCGAVLLTVTVPLQDHVRSTLHLCGRHAQAATVSGAQLGFTALTLGILVLAGVPDAWVPFSAVAVGTAISGFGGLRLARPAAMQDFELPPARALMGTGMALLPAALIQEATVFAASALLASLASAAALGSAEAARVVARPVQAFSLGVSRTLAPRLMEAGESRSRSSARRTAALYVSATVSAGLLYLAVTGWAHPLNPFEAIAPAAYEDEGLVALVIVATLTGAISQIPRGVLLGAASGKELLAITALSACVRLIAVVLLAAAIGAYALPVALLASLAVSGGLGLRGAVRRLDRP